MKKEFEKHAKKRGFSSVKEMKKYFFDRKEGLSFLSIKNAFEDGYRAGRKP